MCIRYDVLKIVLTVILFTLEPFFVYDRNSNECEEIIVLTCTVITRTKWETFRFPNQTLFCISIFVSQFPYKNYGAVNLRLCNKKKFGKQKVSHFRNYRYKILRRVSQTLTILLYYIIYIV